MDNSALHQFNDAVRLFVADLKHIFGESDPEILRIELLIDILKVNARIVIRPFQKSICNNSSFVQNIMREDRDYFVHYRFEDMKALNESEYYMRLLHKFREAITTQINKKTQTAIFNWFKIMIYHAYKDDGLDADAIMKDIALQPNLTTSVRSEGGGGGGGDGS